MPSQKNLEQVSQISEQIGKAQSIVFANYAGLSVATQTKLRRLAKETDGEFTVQKNRLLKVALNKSLGNLPAEVDQVLNGPTAILYSFKDVASSIKVLVEFAKENEALSLKLGLIPGNDQQATQVLNLDEIKKLASLPSKNELIAMLLARLKGPMYGLVNVLSGNSRKLVYVLKAIQDKKSN